MTMTRTAPRDAAIRAAARIVAWNDEHGDPFRDWAAHAIDDARQSFRADPEADLPAPGEDPLLDALDALAGQLDASPETIAAACDAVVQAARGRATRSTHA